uniref:Piscidin 5-like protein type 4 n=1 Tax=Larimichthys crocea TaxID=215358 RepID=A0A873QID9_LARCR|nr:piscidin 5-like protein type 4 [Larimichthys crocea]
MKGVMIFLVLTLVVLMAGESLGQIVYGHNTHVGGSVGDIGGSFNGVRYRSRWQRSLPGSEDDGSK